MCEQRFGCVLSGLLWCSLAGKQSLSKELHNTRRHVFRQHFSQVGTIKPKRVSQQLQPPLFKPSGVLRKSDHVSVYHGVYNKARAVLKVSVTSWSAVSELQVYRVMRGSKFVLVPLFAEVSDGEQSALCCGFALRITWLMCGLEDQATPLCSYAAPGVEGCKFLMCVCLFLHCSDDRRFQRALPASEAPRMAMHSKQVDDLRHPAPARHY